MINKLFEIYGMEKEVTPNIRHFIAGHFPENLIYPGVLLVDILQRVVIKKLLDEMNKLYYITFIDSVFFKKILKQSEKMDLKFYVCTNENDILVNATIFSSEDEILTANFTLKEVEHD